VASLLRGAVGKGAFAEGFWQLRSATLGKIFPARVVPALPSVVARGSRQRIFLKKIKNRLCLRPLTGALGTGFFKKKTLCRRPLPVALGTCFFQKKNKKPPLCRRPGLNAVGKEGFKKTVNLPRR
jgi:hypothetical protein